MAAAPPMLMTLSACVSLLSPISVWVSVWLGRSAQPWLATATSSASCAAARFGSSPRPGLGIPPAGPDSASVLSGMITCSCVRFL